MKKLTLSLIILIASQTSLANNLVTNPSSATDDTVTPTGSNYVTMTVNAASGSQPGLSVTNSYDYDAIDAVSYSSNGVGVFGYGGYAGLYGESNAGYSGFFISGDAANTMPTLVVQRTGSSALADLFDVQTESGANMVQVLSNGQAVFFSSVQLSTGSSQPSCNSGNRGLMWNINGTGSTPDTLQVCQWTGSTYSWTNH